MSRTPQDPDDRSAADAGTPDKFDRLLSMKEVQGLIGMGPSSIYAWARDGRFVQPIRLGARCTRWKLSQVQAWIAAQGDEGKAP